MISFTKSEKHKLKEILSKCKESETRSILRKINSEKRLKYVHNREEIKKLLKKAYMQKKKVKIQYYSLSSDEVRWRAVAIYNFKPDFIIAFCYLRNEERTFVIRRINSAALLDEDYKIPKGWRPESRVW